MRRGARQKIGNSSIADWTYGGFCRRIHFQRSRIGKWCKNVLARRLRHAAKAECRTEQAEGQR